MRQIGYGLLAGTYLLTLSTQLPHIYDVYSALEQGQHRLFGVSTALGAAIAFEASVAVLTWRLIVNRKSERSPWTRPGVAGFLLVSVVANLSYYFAVEMLDNLVMPLLLAVAIPLALWLYAEEFGYDAGRVVRRASREREAAALAVLETERTSSQQFACWCGEWKPSGNHRTAMQARNALNAHQKLHHREVRRMEVGKTPENARRWLEVRYGSSRNGRELPALPSASEIEAWMQRSNG